MHLYIQPNPEIPAAVRLEAGSRTSLLTALVTNYAAEPAALLLLPFCPVSLQALSRTFAFLFVSLFIYFFPPPPACGLTAPDRRCLQWVVIILRLGVSGLSPHQWIVGEVGASSESLHPP